MLIGLNAQIVYLKLYIYIGRQECTEANIFSWAAPLVGELYYKGTSMRSARQRLLKRIFHLHRTTLDDIVDEFTHPHRSVLLDLPDDLRDLPSEVADNLLINLLAESRDNAMRDIVRSIQEQQYRITAQRKPDENLFFPGNFYHLVQNGVDGQKIAGGRSEQVAFIECLQKHFTPNPVKIVAYCLLPSCYHLLVHLQTGELDKLIMRPFAQDFNERISHSKRSLLESTFSYHYLASTTEVISMTRAIHWCPVLSGVAKKPAEWVFSSYQDYIGLRKGTLSTLTYVLSSFLSPAAYEEYVNRCTTDEQKAMIGYLQYVQPFLRIEYA